MSFSLYFRDAAIATPHSSPLGKRIFDACIKDSAKCRKCKISHVFFQKKYQMFGSIKKNAYLCIRNSEMVPVVQLVRASDCGSECRGFESHRAPKKKACKANTYKLFCFLARYSIANTGHRGTLRMFVLTAGISHNRKTDARSRANQMT